jgi:outer membrane receptor protein involved in Fe transport
MASKRKYWLAIGVAIALHSAVPAAAQTRSINVPSEEAAKSIPEFARQENIQIIAPVSQLHGIKTPAVSGSIPLDEALAALLVGTGLEVASNDGVTIVLRRAVAAPPIQILRAPDPGPPPSESIVVTGSRVISDAGNSPTPLTMVPAQQLRATSPTNLPDGLNKLPIFQGSQQIRRAGDGSTNLASNVLNLRNFGVQRTLVLLDGHRAPPSNSDGTVDIDTLPQMLVSRVDIVTGGASAVYGSDAVTGVVNFVLDKQFNGFRIDTNSGISNFGDAASYRFGAVAGGVLFGGRGHIEGSVEYLHQDGFKVFDRPYGPSLYAEVGSGTAANPFTYIPNGRRPNSSFGGLINNCVAPCPAAGMQFVSNGVLGLFDSGIPGARDAAGNPTLGTGNENSGGDGAYSPFGTAQDAYRQGSLFARFSYQLSPALGFYLQGTASEAFSTGWHFPMKLTPTAGQASTFFKNNPFLPAAVQAQLGNNGLSDATNSFQLGEFLVGLGQSENNGATNVNRMLSLQTGLDGTLFNGRAAWNLFYIHGENRLAVDLINNQNYQKLFAASDAVTGPNGTVRCYAATQSLTAARYADCIPLNPFGPIAVTRDAFNYFAELTTFRQTNILDNLGGGISGPLFDSWAGPVSAALSVEARWNDYTVTTNAPITTVDCTGLRICASTLPLYAQPIVAPVHAANSVWEIAGEAVVPLLKDAPLARSLDLNLAGRYTDYSTSGSVQTWKIGLVYNVVENLRFRGTASLDIRAPTLNDLSQPAQVGVIGFSDIHTATNSTTFNVTQGNADLTPEISRTYTLGAVWTPNFAPGLTASLDYFRIHMKNAINQIQANSLNVQSLCENSGGTSPFCALYQRPFAFSNTSPANYPSRIFTRNLNTAAVQTEGFDFEANYSFAMADLVEDWTGAWTVRTLATYQPVLQSIAFPGAPIVRVSGIGAPNGPKTRFTGFLAYSKDDWTLGLQDRWLSGFSQVSQTGQVWLNPHVRSFNLVDVNIERKFALEGGELSAYLVIQNLIGAQPDLVPSMTNIGLNYPVAPGQDIVGRYFTIGLRANL